MSGTDVELLSESIERYLQEVAKRIRNQTLGEKRKDLLGFAAWLKVDLEASDVTRKIAGKYVTEWLSPKALAPATLKKSIGNLAAFFTWLQGRGVIDHNPFQLMSRTIAGSTRGKAAARRPFTDAEALQLVKALKIDDPLMPLVLLGMYTGMRREEICELKVTDIERGALIVREGKSRSAIRGVPIHPVIKELVDQLAATTSDAYLIHGVLTGGRDSRRGHFAGKRFGRLLRKAGLTDPALVYHSLRGAFIQRCREADVPRETTALLVGHSLSREMTYGDAGGGYSKGLELKLLRAAVSKVTYGPLDALAKKLGPTVQVTMKSARRPRATRQFRKSNP